jgi:hypothetical protein
MSAATFPGGPVEDDSEETPPPQVEQTGDEPSWWDMASLAERIEGVQQQETLQARLESLPCAWVLVFDEDTEEEAVYSMELAGRNDDHVVLAFEDRNEAETYALSLSQADPMDVDYAGYDSVASVQGLDVEALIVTSRDAEFKVGVVFRGDLLSQDAIGGSSSSRPRADATGWSTALTGGFSSVHAEFPAYRTPPRVSITITMVPDTCFEGSTAEEFLDPNDDPLWVLIQDEGTADAQFFSMALNGTESVICFKDEESAQRCSRALRMRGNAVAHARPLQLDDLMERLEGSDVEVSLVDEVIETLNDEVIAADSAPDASRTPRIVASDTQDVPLGELPSTPAAGSSTNSLAPLAVRAMLEGLYDGASSNTGSGDGAADGAVDGTAEGVSAEEVEEGGGPVGQF